MVYDENGVACYGADATNLFVSHFQNFLGTQDDVYMIEDARSLFIKKLDMDKAVDLIKPVTDDEIKKAIFSIDDNKASGPDGFTSKFFKAAWNVIGKDTCSAIKEFFTSGKLLGEFNTTLISLVPKTKSPTRVTDYRPISCCNVVYKGISKVISNRLKLVLNELVDSNQSAFIPGRQISDNILLAQEFMIGYSWKDNARNCAFKVDIQKAYDTVSWDFLESCLLEFGFHRVMIHWIMTCIRTASFSVCINGEVHGFFKARRGLRQGDPISPYLFTLVMEVLNLMVKRQISRDNRFRYHSRCSKLKITSLSFADDLLMLCHGDLISASILRRGLDEFSISSGLYPSMNKSEAFFCSLPPDVVENIKLVMPYREGTLPIRYLGVPLVSRRVNNDDCRVLVEIVQNRIKDWRNRYLSFAGRLQLVTSVLSTLQVYWCSMFILPTHICDTVDKLLKKFLWGCGNNNTGMISVSWKETCKPKSQGGLGLRSLRDWNHALMAKHLWNIACDKDSLWVRWVKIYRLKGGNIWDVEIDKGRSWCWKQILGLRDFIKDFVIVKIGNGENCNFWFDKWHSRGPLCRLINHRLIMEAGFKLDSKVCDMIENGVWIWPSHWKGRFDEVLKVPVPYIDKNIEDRIVWCNRKGKEKDFSVGEVWKVIRTISPKVIWYKHIWYNQCIPRHAFIAWMAVKGRLKTRDRLTRWFNIPDLTCLLCKSEDESHSHLFFSCTYSKRLWERLKPLALLENISNNWASVISGITCRPAINRIWSVIQRLVFSAAIYFIWQERNFRIYRQSNRHEDCIFDIICETVRFKLRGLTLKQSSEVIRASSMWNLPISMNVGHRDILINLFDSDDADII